MKKKCPICQSVDELAPSLSYCPKHKYSNEKGMKDMKLEILKLIDKHTDKDFGTMDYDSFAKDVIDMILSK